MCVPPPWREQGPAPDLLCGHPVLHLPASVPGVDCPEWSARSRFFLYWDSPPRPRAHPGLECGESSKVEKGFFCEIEVDGVLDIKSFLVLPVFAKIHRRLAPLFWRFLVGLEQVFFCQMDRPVVAYSIGGTAVSIKLGEPLVGLNFEQVCLAVGSLLFNLNQNIPCT